MNRFRIESMSIAAFCICSLFFAGCIFGPDEDGSSKKSDAFKPLTDKENVIYNLVKSYEKADIDHFIELLHEDYVFYCQEDDYRTGKVDSFFTKDKDIEITRNIFLAAKKQHPEPLKNIESMALTIEAAPWQPLDSLGGVICEDCWTTTRAYILSLVLNEGYMTLIAEDMAEFIVVPVDYSGTKIYKIFSIRDIDRP